MQRLEVPVLIEIDDVLDGPRPFDVDEARAVVAESDGRERRELLNGRLAVGGLIGKGRNQEPAGTCGRGGSELECDISDGITEWESRRVVLNMRREGCLSCAVRRTRNFIVLLQRD